MKKFLLLLLGFLQISAQNVGIGIAVPASKLSVLGNLSIGTNYSGIAAPADGVIIEGFTGIGTDNPLAPLHVRKDSTPQIPNILIENSSAPGGTSPRIAFVDTWTSTVNVAPAWGIDNLKDRFRIWSQPNIYTSGTEHFTILSNGNVGMGVASPVTNLHVAGNLYAGMPSGCDVQRTVAGGGTATDITTTGASVNGGNLVLTLDGASKVQIDAHVTFQPTGNSPWVGLNVCATNGTTTVCGDDNNYHFLSSAGYVTLSTGEILTLPSGGTWTIYFTIHKRPDAVSAVVHTYKLCAHFVSH